MKETPLNSILTSLAIIVFLCLCSCSKDGMDGKEYVGYYKPIERMSLEFRKNSEVVGKISSTDFVGRFSDRLYGRYEYKHPHIAITWEKADADIVGWDWTLGFEKNGRYMRQADFDSPLQALKNLMGGTMRWNLWLFLVKRKLLIDNDIRFIEGANMGEDMMVMIKAFLKAGKVIQIHKPLYRYNAISQTSLSRQFSEERRQEISENLAEAEKAIMTSAYSVEMKDYVNHLKLVLKLGYSHPIELVDPAGITTETPDATTVIIKGIDKAQVGNYAADVRGWRPPEPYKGKGVLYDGEVVHKKEGKSAAK